MTKISTKLTGNKVMDRIAYKIVRFIVTSFSRMSPEPLIVTVMRSTVPLA